jgi:hypothetical protein
VAHAEYRNRRPTIRDCHEAAPAAFHTIKSVRVIGFLRSLLNAAVLIVG